jgi:hypothetical protein
VECYTNVKVLLSDLFLSFTTAFYVQRLYARTTVSGKLGRM